jgi:carboxymethylenebutenolidase
VVPSIALTIPTPDGDCAATLHTPGGSGPWPAVLFYVDAGGVRQTMRAMADRLAGLGYAVLVPDVYHRTPDWQPFDVATMFSDPDERARLMGLIGSVTPAAYRSDADAFLAALGGRPEVAGDRVGTTGYCMGGRASLIVAAHRPDRIAAAASFHGGGLAKADDPESPHHRAGDLAARVYVAGAVEDGSFTDDDRALLEEALTEAGVEHTVETYPAHHGFAVPDNPTHDAAAEERHWAALEELYGAALR